MKKIIIPFILIFSLIPSGETTIEYPRENNSPYIDVRTAYQNINEQFIVLSSKTSENANLSRIRRYESYLQQYDNWNVMIMLDIMECESNFNPKAVGDTDTKYYSYGLLQIRNLPSRNYPIETLFNPEENIEVANKVFIDQGYGAWYNCYNKVKYN
jgi:soluble lytic murein transglycosylase-like protein